MKRILVTTDFCNGSKKLISDHKTEEINDLRTVLILLANGRPIPKRFKDHQLKKNEFRELHISGDTLLLYRNETDSDTLVVSLKLTNISDHKSLNRDSTRDDYEYKEVSTTDLHNITSATKFELSPFEEESLYDLVESLADYASMKLSYGYVELENYYISGTDLHCEYNYISYESGVSVDDVDFIIPLGDYILVSVSELEQYIDEFAETLCKQFE